MRIPMMIVVTLATALCWGGRASAQTVTCTPITSLPFTINDAGAFCLTGNLSYSSSGAAITINYSGAVLDLNGYRLLYNGTATSGSQGVKVLAGHPNVVIRNGLISSFQAAVDTFSAGTIVEDTRLYPAGVTSNGVIIEDGADGTIVRRNYIRNADAAVNVFANSARIVENDIYGADSTYDQGITVFSTNAFIVGNRFSRLTWAIYFSNGASGKYRDNLTLNVTTPFLGGSDAGNND